MSTDRKEVGDMVSEGAVVGMLLNGHDLDGVVAQRPDPGQHLSFELQVAVDFRLLQHPNAHVMMTHAQWIHAHAAASMQPGEGAC